MPRNALRQAREIKHSYVSRRVYETFRSLTHAILRLGDNLEKYFNLKSGGERTVRRIRLARSLVKNLRSNYLTILNLVMLALAKALPFPVLETTTIANEGKRTPQLPGKHCPNEVPEP